MDIFIAGKVCIINSKNDLFMEYEARPFIGQECFIVKKTKNGLIQVALKNDRKMMYSFAPNNIDFLPEVNVEFEKALSYEEGMIASDEKHKRAIMSLQAEVNRLNKRLHAAESRVHNQRIEIARLLGHDIESNAKIEGQPD